MRRTWLVTVILLSAALLLTTMSCRKEPRGRCGRLIADLTSPAKAKEAIRLLGEKQGEKSCAKAIPQLTKMFEEGRYRSDILRTVKHMGKKEATQFEEYKKLIQLALKEEETDAIAASIIEDWKLSELKDDLVAMVSGKDTNPKSHGAALNALLSFSKAEDIEDILISLAEKDPDKQGIRVNVTATEELSKIRSAKALPALVKTLFLKTQRGEEMYQAARLSLVRVGGEPAEKILLATLNGSNDDLRSWARSNGIADWQWMDGPKVVQVLGDLSNPEAAAAVAQNMAKKLIEPAGITDQALEEWKISNSNRITINMLTLARIGNDAAVPILAALIADPMADFKQRMDSASALAAIGSPAAVDALFKIYEESTDQRFRAPFLRPVTAALDADHLAKFDELMAKEQKEEKELVLERLQNDPLVLGCIAVVRECGKDTSCILKALDAEPGEPAPVEAPEGEEPSADALEAAKQQASDIAQSKQWKAVLLLAREEANAAAVVPALLEKFKKAPASATDIRNYVLIALERIGRNDEKVFKGLEEIVKEEREKAGFGFWNIELDARITAYKARKEGPPRGDLPPGVIGAEPPVEEGGAPAPAAPPAESGGE